jgi:hypothetical protein
MPKEEEKCSLEIGGFHAEVFDTDTAVFEYTALSIYVTDR